MLVMDHPVFRRFWYPVIPVEHLKDGPQRSSFLVNRWRFSLMRGARRLRWRIAAATVRPASLSGRSSMASLPAPIMGGNTNATVSAC